MVGFFKNVDAYYNNGAPLYIEIGNEPNPSYNEPEYQLNGLYDYQAYEAIAAIAASIYLPSFPFQIDSAGMAEPTALESTPPYLCPDTLNPTGNPNIWDAGLGTFWASLFVPWVGVAVHPYSYNSNEANGTMALYWQNYYGVPGSGMNPPYGTSTYGYNQYAGACFDIMGMWRLWNGFFSGQQIIFTEDNWTNQPKNPDDCLLAYKGDGCPGQYLADLFTYMVDKGWTTTYPPVMMAWYTSADTSNPPGLGLFDANAYSKFTNLGVCNYDNLVGEDTLDAIYYELSSGQACY